MSKGQSPTAVALGQAQSTVARVDAALALVLATAGRGLTRRDLLRWAAELRGAADKLTTLAGRGE